LRKKTHTPAALGLRLESHNGKTKLRKKHYKTKPPQKKSEEKVGKRTCATALRLRGPSLNAIARFPFSLSPCFLLLLPLLLLSSFGELPNASYHTSKTQTLIGQVGHETNHTSSLTGVILFIYIYKLDL
jgi:hypothetical protein